MKMKNMADQQFSHQIIMLMHRYMTVLINEECFQVSQKLPWAQRNRQASTCQIC